METLLSFFAETFWLLRCFGHLSHSYVKTCHSSAHYISLYLQTFWLKWLNFFGNFKNISVYDWKKQLAPIEIAKQVKNLGELFHASL